MMGSKSLWKGIAAGLAAGAAFGTAGYWLSDGCCSKKARLKYRAEKAIHAISEVMESLTDLWR